MDIYISAFDLFIIFDLGEVNVQLCQVVDLRDDTDIYWDIKNYNSSQNGSRVFGIIGGVFLSIITIAIDSLVILTWGKTGRSIRGRQRKAKPCKVIGKS